MLKSFVGITVFDSLAAVSANSVAFLELFMYTTRLCINAVRDTRGTRSASRIALFFAYHGWCSLHFTKYGSPQYLTDSFFEVFLFITFVFKSIE